MEKITSEELKNKLGIQDLDMEMLDAVAGGSNTECLTAVKAEYDACMQEANKKQDYNEKRIEMEKCRRTYEAGKKDCLDK